MSTLKVQFITQSQQLIDVVLEEIRQFLLEKQVTGVK